MSDYEMIIADPAGNLTAIVRGCTEDPAVRARISQSIMEAGLAEQVGFETYPIRGGDCRLEMMGGEFCGNATRAYGYLHALRQGCRGSSPILVEISGAPEPIPVQVDPERHTAFASMPLPIGVEQAAVDGRSCPVVCMDGIHHMIVELPQPLSHPELAQFAAKALEAMDAPHKDACGVMFLWDDWLTPVVYVSKTDTLVWESSCGSGSVAAAWYRVRSLSGGEPQQTITFREPGGTLQVTVQVQDNRICGCTMGGSVAFRDAAGSEARNLVSV